MNKEEIKNRIAKLLGMKYSFGSYKTISGVELKVEKEMLEVSAPIYVITPEGELPAPEGSYELEDGMVVKVKDGSIEEIIPVMAGEKEMMDSAELIDGTKVTNNLDEDFAVGQTLFVITEGGDVVPGPEGEHTTKSGIVFTLDAEGKITGLKKPEETGEGSLETSEDEIQTEELMKQLLTALENLNTNFEALKSEQKSLEQKFSKFAAEPATSKVYDRKGYELSSVGNRFDKLEAFSKFKQTIKK